MENQLGIKILLFLRLVRWYNVGLILLSQYLIAYFVFLDGNNFWILWQDIKLHCLIFGTAFATSGAFIINSFYDLNKDLVNRPKSVVFSRLLGKELLLNVYVVLNVIALMFMLVGSFKIFLYGIILIFMFWFYSHKLQKLALLREISASLLAVAPLFAVWLHYSHWHYGMVIYLGSLLIVGFTREVIKDMEGHKGNIIFGYQTVVVAAGPSFARKWLALVNLLICIAFVIGFFLFAKHLNYFSLISGVSVFTAFVISLVLLFKQDEQFNFVADNVLKMTIVVHLTSLLFSGWVEF